MPPDAPVTERLPRGRHGLSREEVVQSQRNRMLLAMAEGMAERGYADTSVADVLRRAGVSRQTFYEQFESKAECFAAAHEAAAGILLSRMRDQLDGAEEPSDGSIESRVARTERFLAAYLDAIAAEPAFARLFLVEVYAAGPVAVTRRIEVQERFGAIVAEMLGATTEDQLFACEALVSAVSSMTTARVAAGEAAGLPELREPFARLVRKAMPVFSR